MGICCSHGIAIMIWKRAAVMDMFMAAPLAILLYEALS